MKHLKHLLISLVFITSACTSSQSGGGELTIPSQWKLVSFGEPGAETQVIEGSSITLEFEGEGQVGGTGGCNSYGAKYETQGNTLTIQDIVSTLMACADSQVTEQEQKYFDALKTAARFEISGDNLTIWYKDGQGRLNYIKATSG